MLALVENARRKQLAWVHAILDHRKWRPTRLAREAGIDPSTLSKFLGDPLNIAQLNTLSIEKIAAAGGIPPYQTQPVSMPRGMAEGEAAPYVTEAPDAALARAIQAAKAGKNGVDPWIMRSRALELAGYLPGDILMVDLNAEPQDGDAVCAQVYDKIGRAETVMRIYEKPFLAAATTDRSLSRPLLIDDDRVQVRGVVVASFRARRAA